MEAPSYYRKKAEDVRAFAVSLQAASLRRMMMEVATQWDDLARQSEHLARVRAELAQDLPAGR